MRRTNQINKAGYPPDKERIHGKMLEKQKKEEAANASRTEDMTTSEQTTSIKTINPKTSKKRQRKGKTKQQQPANAKHMEPSNKAKAIEAEQELCNKLRIRQELHG